MDDGMGNVEWHDARFFPETYKKRRLSVTQNVSVQ